jgi:hypothetical protein
MEPPTTADVNTQKGILKRTQSNTKNQNGASENAVEPTHAGLARVKEI